MSNENVVPISAANKTNTKPGGPSVGRSIFPGPDAPLEVARELYKAFRTPSGRTLINHRGDWMSWTGQQWKEQDTANLRATVYKQLGNADYERPIRKGGETVDHETVPWNPNKHKVANVLEALSAVGHLGANIDAPAWIGKHDIEDPADQMIACTNGLLSLSTRFLTEHTPAFYNTVSVPFAYQSDAPKPQAWLKFLSSVWPDDTASIALMQEWIGYTISGRTDMQKILFVVGPTRSGKGTISRVLRNLIGHGNITGPTLASLGTNFGLAPLLGKPLAVIPDARINGPVHTIVERLLSISGEDMLTVDRKFREPWSGKLPTRIMVLSNEIPRFTDASGAIANRMLVLQMRNSFLGREDRTLDHRLAEELPGILNWALEGLDRLTNQGRFTVPRASNEATTMLMDLASPVSAFVRDICTRGTGMSVERDRLYMAWKVWCEDNGHEAGAKATFGRNLSAVVPDLGTFKPRINGMQVRCYTRIGLVHVSPVSADKTAGQRLDAEADGRASAPDPNQGQFDDESGQTASPVEVKQQVNAIESHESRTDAFKDQQDVTTKKPSAQKWFANHVAEHRAAGHQQVDQVDVCDAGEAAGHQRQSIIGAASKHPDVKVIGRGKTSTWWIDPDTPAPTYQTATEWLAGYVADMPDGTVIDIDAVKAACVVHSWPNLRYAAGQIKDIEVDSSGQGKPATWTVRRRPDGEVSA